MSCFLFPSYSHAYSHDDAIKMIAPINPGSNGFSSFSHTRRNFDMVQNRVTLSARPREACPRVGGQRRSGKPRGASIPDYAGMTLKPFRRYLKHMASEPCRDFRLISDCREDLTASAASGALTTPSTLPNSFFGACRKKNRNALNAWFRVETETCLNTARKVKNPFTSSEESNRGSLLRVNVRDSRVRCT